MTDIALDRLQDRTAAVRKGALGLLKLLLEYNPYSSSLDLHPFEERNEKIQRKLENYILEVKSKLVPKTEMAVKLEKDKILEENQVEIETTDDVVPTGAADLEFLAEDEYFIELKREENNVVSALSFISKMTDAIHR